MSVSAAAAASSFLVSQTSLSTATADIHLNLAPHLCLSSFEIRSSHLVLDWGIRRRPSERRMGRCQGPAWRWRCGGGADGASCLADGGGARRLGRPALWSLRRVRSSRPSSSYQMWYDPHLLISTPSALYFLVCLQIIFCLASVVEIDFEAIDLVTIFSKDLACNFLRSSCIYGKGIWLYYLIAGLA